MAKQIRDVVEVERVVKEKQTVYKMELTPAEVYFIHYMITYGAQSVVRFNNDDSLRLKRLRDFWPQGDSNSPTYEPAKMF